MVRTARQPNVPRVENAVAFDVDGRAVCVPSDGASLLEVLRDRLGIHSVKDGCSPQGQCGCCTVWVDGQPRVACVTPVSRVAGRRVTTIAALPDADRWADAFFATGASQCGFCTPGIIMRLASRGAAQSVDQPLLAHLCRCTGGQPIVEAAALARSDSLAPSPRDLDGAARRASIEGGTPQRVGPAIAFGDGGFADDTAPPDALVAVRGSDGEWVVAETLSQARRLAALVQGRRSPVGVRWPIDAPAGPWARTLQTTWVEPAYLELDASWCAPGGVPTSPLANGGAFGGKVTSTVGDVAARLAAVHGRPVRVVLSREDTVRIGPKRPPLAGGVRLDGSGFVRVARTPGVVEAIMTAAPGLVVEEVDVAGPPTSMALRAAGWGEALVLAGGGDGPIVAPNGAEAEAEVTDAGVRVRVRCGEALDAVVLRSYCIGATAMALGWVRHEAIAVDDGGEAQDLTIRSFGVLRAVDMPPVSVEIDPSCNAPISGSDAVFVAVAAAAWKAAGYPPRWPCAR